MRSRFKSALSHRSSLLNRGQPSLSDPLPSQIFSWLDIIRRDLERNSPELLWEGDRIHVDRAALLLLSSSYERSKGQEELVERAARSLPSSPSSWLPGHRPMECELAQPEAPSASCGRQGVSFRLTATSCTHHGSTRYLSSSLIRILVVWS